MADEAFQKGAVVKLKSGGPPMTVTKADDSVICRWWNTASSKYDIAPFNAFELKPATADR